MLAIALMIRFVLEICLLVVAAWFPFEVVGGPGGLVAGAASALLLMLGWSALLSPKRRVEIGGGPRLALEFALFALASAALASAGHWEIAAALFGLAVIDKSAVVALEHRL